jgi:hypothetical protein
MTASSSPAPSPTSAPSSAAWSSTTRSRRPAPSAPAACSPRPTTAAPAAPATAASSAAASASRCTCSASPSRAAPASSPASSAANQPPSAAKRTRRKHHRASALRTRTESSSMSHMTAWCKTIPKCAAINAIPALLARRNDRFHAQCRKRTVRDSRVMATVGDSVTPRGYVRPFGELACQRATLHSLPGNPNTPTNASRRRCPGCRGCGGRARRILDSAPTGNHGLQARLNRRARNSRTFRAGSGACEGRESARAARPKGVMP